MANFKKIEVENFFKENTHLVIINCKGVNFRITPTNDEEGLKITKISNDMNDSIKVLPYATNQVQVK